MSEDAIEQEPKHKFKGEQTKAGIAEGRRWAGTASYRDNQRMTKAWQELQALRDGGQSPDPDTLASWLADFFIDGETLSRRHALKYIFGAERTDLNTLTNEYVEGFIDGATDVFSDLQAKL